MSFLDNAVEAIHTAGGRMTTQRQLIVELLAATTDQLDADGIYQLARQQDEGINLATVYRTLGILETAGLIRQQYLSPNHDRKTYTRSAGVYHFTCRKCRRVFSFSSELVETLKQHLENDLHVLALNACVCVDGLCPDCRRKEQ
jgi:Fur family ferric uptake transcriptional regulator